MVRARVLFAATAAGLMFASCSKTEDLPATRQLFGTPPQIEMAALNPVETQQVSTSCDFTDYLVKLVCSLGGTSEPLGPIQVSGTYTLARFSARVTDQEGADDVLFVGASFVLPDSSEETTLVLFDDGSTNKFPINQKLVGLDSDCSYNAEAGMCLCLKEIFKVDSGDTTADDSTFTRDMAFYPPSTPPPFMECIMENNKDIGQFIEAGETLTFRVDAVDRAGNLDTWDTDLKIQVQNSTASCTGDPCGCCILQNTQGYDTICAGEEGMYTQEVGMGLCQFFATQLPQ